MMSMRHHIKDQGWTQTEAAAALGVTQPRISDLMRGHIDVFSIDALVRMLGTAGLQIDLQVKRAA